MKKLKFKKKRKNKRKNSKEQQKPNAHRRFMTTIKNVTEKKIKKVKSLIGFLSANKSITTTEVGEREKKKDLQNKSKSNNNKCFS